MLCKITNGSVSYGADTVLENIDFEIKEREKIAVVGRNGCGKSTLLKAIAGDVLLEEGTGEEAFSFIRPKNVTVGYLKQTVFPDSTKTMLNEILEVFKPITDLEAEMNALLQKMEKGALESEAEKYSKMHERFENLGGYTYKKEYLTAIRKFGFSDADMQKPLSEFSGGQLTKISFIKLLLGKPDILLLDEPTNHLDIGAVEWLEDYLRNYKSAIVIVSHDRMFLDKTVGTVYEIEYGETHRYSGNYAAFERQKRENYQKRLKDHEAQRAEIARLTRLVERFRYKATKAKMVQSKLKQIEHMKKADMPDRYDLRTFHSNFQPENESAKNVLKINGLEIGYEKPLAKIDLELFRGEKLGIIGKNGIGKSTLLKTLVGLLSPISGNFEFGVGTKIGYFDQNIAQMRSDKTVFDEFHDEFPSLTETETRNILGSFLFSKEDVFKTVSDLSGGEKVRFALCRILKRRPNVLILDEPTNHTDIVGKETLENMLKAFSGTVICVSHDRYFINKIADKLLVFEDGKAEFFPYGFAEYEEKRKSEEESEETPSFEKKPKTAKKTYTTPLKEKAKMERRAEKLEKAVDEFDAESAALKKELEKPEVFSDYKKLSEIQERLNELHAMQEEASAEWAMIMEELENFRI